MKQQITAGFAILIAALLSADNALAKSAARKVNSRSSSVVTTADAGNDATKPGEIDWIRVLPAERLVNQDVVSSDRRFLGQIDSIMLDVATGDVVYVIVSSENDYLAIPFRALALRGWQDGRSIRVDETYQRVLRNSPHTGGTRMSEDLGDPKDIARTNRAFGVPTPYGYVVPPNPDRDILPNRYLLVRPRNIGALQMERDAKNKDASPAREIRGRQVARADGQPIGEVEYIMLDLEAGRIAYLLLSSGSFLGLGGEWIPVPPEAVEWSPEKETAILKKGVKRTALAPLQRSEPPGFIRRSQLEALYQRFDVTPYQQQSRLD
ncbi:PRC-barrel domain-containing protein [Methylocystis echinoides]|uniref:PRC-barrel domain-containing protein n=1 Tax=Methylocystis echinoides TaxID=29468 RepID=UPI00343CAD16